jgi:hypothetical protein
MKRERKTPRGGEFEYLLRVEEDGEKGTPCLEV